MTATLVMLVLGLFWQASKNGFVYDDYLSIETNTALRQPDLAHYTTHPETAWASQVKDTGGIYRPLGVWILAREYSLIGLNPSGWHRASIALHAINILLLFLLFLILFRKDTLAFLAALLFAVHPAGTEAILWATQQPTLWAMSFSLLALLCFARSFDGWHPWSLNACAALCALMAVFTKEQTIVLPLFAIAIVWTKGLSVKKAWGGVALMTLSSIVYAIFRFLYLGSFAQTATPWGESYYSAGLTMTRGAAHYLKLAFIPHPLTVNYDSFGVSHSITDVRVLISAGVLLVLACGLWKIWQKRESTRNAYLILFGVGWFFIALLPVNNILNPLREIINERFLYLALPGILIAIAGVGHVAYEKLPTEKNAYAFSFGVSGLMALILAMLGYQTFMRIGDWQNEERLWRAAASVHELDIRNHHNLAIALEKQIATDEALHEYETAHKLAQGSSAEKRETISLASAYLRAQKPEAALAAIGTLYSGLPDNDEALFLYANALLKRHNYQDAAKAFTALAHRNPNDNEYLLHAVLAATLARDTRMFADLQAMRSSEDMRGVFLPLSEAREKMIMGSHQDGIKTTVAVLNTYRAPSPFVLLWLGAAFESTGDRASAATMYKIAYTSPFTAIAAAQGLHRLGTPLY